MSQIYKLNHIQGEEIKHIYIFSNDISIATPEYVDSQGQPVFTTDEKENIDAKNIPVDIITATQLHGDDTIGMIKKKIMTENLTKEAFLEKVFDFEKNS